MGKFIQGANDSETESETRGIQCTPPCPSNGRSERVLGASPLGSAPIGEEMRRGSAMDELWNPVPSEIDYNVFDFECETYEKNATESAANSVINTKAEK